MTGSAQPPMLDHARLAAIRSLFKDLPDGFDERHAALKAIRDEFHDQLARNFEPVLNEYAQLLPQDTYDEKRKTASMINGLLRSVGLTIQDKRGRAAVLYSDTHSAEHPEITRFRLEAKDEQGRVRRTGAWRYMPSLTLMQEHPRQEYWAKRLQREPKSPER